MKNEYLAQINGVWFYEDPTYHIANVRGRGLTKEDAYKHWQFLTGDKS